LLPTPPPVPPPASMQREAGIFVPKPRLKMTGSKIGGDVYPREQPPEPKGKAS
jgi:hypothetical protein